MLQRRAESRFAPDGFGTGGTLSTFLYAKLPSVKSAGVSQPLAGGGGYFRYRRCPNSPGKLCGARRVSCAALVGCARHRGLRRLCCADPERRSSRTRGTWRRAGESARIPSGATGIRRSLVHRHPPARIRGGGWRGGSAPAHPDPSRAGPAQSKSTSKAQSESLRTTAPSSRARGAGRSPGRPPRRELIIPHSSRARGAGGQTARPPQPRTTPPPPTRGFALPIHAGDAILYTTSAEIW